MKEKKVISKKKVAKKKEVVVNSKKVVKKADKAKKTHTHKVLVRVLKLLNIKAAALAKSIGTSASYLSRWLYEIDQVPLKHALAIEALTNGKIKAKAISPVGYAVAAKKLRDEAKAAKKATKGE